MREREGEGESPVVEEEREREKNFPVDLIISNGVVIECWRIRVLREREAIECAGLG